MDNKKYDFLLKYIVIGDSGVGKSNIFLQFIRNIFKSTHEVTIGVEFGAKNIEYNGKSITSVDQALNYLYENR